MSSIWKKVFTFGAIAGFGYLGFKGYQRMSEIIKLSKTLPDYLTDLLDEKPNVDINMRLNSLSLAIGLSPETFENLNFDLDSQINRYIADYYPSLSKLNISTHKYIKSSITKHRKETEDCTTNEVDENICNQNNAEPNNPDNLEEETEKE